MAQLHIQIVMPNDKKLDDLVDQVILPGVEGDFEVLDGHTPFITKLRSGILKVFKKGKAEFFAMHDGFVTIEDNSILILSESCENKTEINLDRAIAAKDRAEKRMANTSDIDTDFRRAESALKRALARIDTIKHT